MTSQESHPKVIRESELHIAVTALANGGVLAYPTETVYGLGAAMSCRLAVKRIFDIKGRRAMKSLSFMVDSITRARELSADLSDTAVNLMSKYWPGPLTLVVNASASLPEYAVSQNGTIGLRCPDNRICNQLVRQLDDAISTTSANRSAEPPALSAQAVCTTLGRYIDVIIDGGISILGVASTVLDVTGQQPVLLRAGAIPFSEIIK